MRKLLNKGTFTGFELYDNNQQQKWSKALADNVIWFLLMPIFGAFNKTRCHHHFK